jgi:hypothetical protein
VSRLTVAFEELKEEERQLVLRNETGKEREQLLSRKLFRG